jgi:(1->4)-alpha-D-glucan 1-alpha-D-glucosylmutase
LRELEVTRPAEAPQGSAYLIIEKILSRGERLRTTWETDGTTGYDFMDEVNAVQHDAAGEPVLTALWTRISGRYANFDAEEELARRQMLDRSFSAQRKSVVRALYVVAQRGLETRDIPWAAIHRALTEILVHFPVYRIYARVDQAAETDRAFLGHAVARAKRSCLPGDVWLIERLALWLSGTPITAGDDPLQNLALVRFAQLSTSLCAKAVEDTAFYRYGRLISRNDVGFDVRRFSSTKADFHEAMMRRAMDFPHAMLATATHDHKRGEDVRARLAILSERASDWAAAIDRWIAAIAPHCIVTDGTVMPSHSDLTILFQTLVGAWPMTLSVADSGGLDAYAKRIAAWQQKALREAKLHSDWTAPNEAYERAAADVVARLFSDRRDVLSEIEAFARGIMAAGAVNSLAQTLVKITAPGVPDIYQGTEFWDFSLVDPDNRTPVNFEARQKSLPLARAERLLPAWRDGRIKQFVIASALAVRKDLAPTFFEGTYVPLEIAGPMAEHVLGFARIWRSVRAIIAVPRCIAHMISDDEALAIDGGIWGDSRLKIPGNLQASYCDAFASGERQRVAADIPIERLFARLPVAFLTTRSD